MFFIFCPRITLIDANVEAFVSNAWFGAWHKHRNGICMNASKTITKFFASYSRLFALFAGTIL
jgi:hypothetical protein